MKAAKTMDKCCLTCIWSQKITRQIDGPSSSYRFVCSKMEGPSGWKNVSPTFVCRLWEAKEHEVHKA